MCGPFCSARDVERPMNVESVRCAGWPGRHHASMKATPRMTPPRASELAAFACLCAVLLFLPATPLVAHFALFASARGLSPAQAASLLVGCVFACLAVVAAFVFLSFAGVRRLQR